MAIIYTMQQLTENQASIVEVQPDIADISQGRVTFQPIQIEALHSNNCHSIKRRSFATGFLSEQLN